MFCYYNDNASTEIYTYCDPLSLHDALPISETGGLNSDGENYVRSDQSHPLSYVWTNTLSYNMSNDKHSLDAVAGVEYTRFVQEGFWARREGVDRKSTRLNSIH